MKQFRSNKITQNNETIANELKSTRLKKNLKLSTVSAQTGINIKYLEALESGQLNKLPAGLYGRNFLKEYSVFLGIEPDSLLELFDQERIPDQEGRKKDPFFRKIPRPHFFLVIPKIIKNFLVILLVVICLGYIAYYLQTSFAPPEVKIFSPDDNITIQVNQILVQGITEAEAEVIINDEPIMIGSDGKFQKILNLRNGLNTISIIAQKKYSRRNFIVRKIFVDNNGD